MQIFTDNMRCKNCEFWGTYRHNACDREGDLHTERTPQSAFDIDAYANDDTGLTAYLITGPDFGCVQFVEKEKKRTIETLQSKKPYAGVLSHAMKLPSGHWRGTLDEDALGRFPRHTPITTSKMVCIFIEEDSTYLETRNTIYKLT